ncbi:dienelactone hydrolase [Luteibacter sp. Sphag1AF]|uniref:dienelactone hydrolase family protein n=1 Tax=Luteibacter sp. Sphag1AF TaxID=2587031 RepID=UPI00161EDFD1|nr:dienelactone hydrolase family protein [Luteibacter sp. Sphag1AF]MBB3227654.1 dienelactone hydrolase [Luteibacter sp. Sphag1AF]
MRSLVLLLLLGCTGAANAAMVAKPVQWTDNGTTFKSVLVYDDAVTTPRPGLVMVPNWYGVNDMAIAKAKSIAGKDYVILLTDMYGGSVRPTTDADATAAVKPLYGDRALMRHRVTRALDELKAQAGKAPIDTTRLGALGFCFGGSAVLDLARSGANIAAVVTFHGLLSTDDPSLARNIKAHVLALNGADDTNVPTEQKVAFESEMRDAKVDWSLVDYGGAVHCFTEKEATGKPGNCRYDERTATRAYKAMHAFLDESFHK